MPTSHPQPIEADRIPVQPPIFETITDRALTPEDRFQTLFEVGEWLRYRLLGADDMPPLLAGAVVFHQAMHAFVGSYSTDTPYWPSDSRNMGHFVGFTAAAGDTEIHEVVRPAWEQLRVTDADELRRFDDGTLRREQPRRADTLNALIWPANLKDITRRRFEAAGRDYREREEKFLRPAADFIADSPPVRAADDETIDLWITQAVDAIPDYPERLRDPRNGPISSERKALLASERRLLSSEMVYAGNRPGRREEAPRRLEIIRIRTTKGPMLVIEYRDALECRDETSGETLALIHEPERAGQPRYDNRWTYAKGRKWRLDATGQKLSKPWF
ncbi:MAG: hypothetical protein ACPGU7_12310 [Gammaproteobacteria bacterium]